MLFKMLEQRQWTTLASEYSFGILSPSEHLPPPRGIEQHPQACSHQHLDGLNSLVLRRVCFGERMYIYVGGALYGHCHVASHVMYTTIRFSAQTQTLQVEAFRSNKSHKLSLIQ